MNTLENIQRQPQPRLYCKDEAYFMCRNEQTALMHRFRTNCWEESPGNAARGSNVGWVQVSPSDSHDEPNYQS
jgi:hypothetical protein